MQYDLFSTTFPSFSSGVDGSLADRLGLLSTHWLEYPYDWIRFPVVVCELGLPALAEVPLGHNSGVLGSV